MKLKLILLFLLITLTSISSADVDCGTPVECYIRATEKLNDARKALSEVEAKVDEKLDDKVKELTAKFESEISEVKKQSETEKTSLVQSIETLKAEINNKAHKTNWTNTPLTLIGSVNFGNSSTSALDIKGSFPSTASEILLAVYVFTGDVGGDSNKKFKIFVSDGSGHNYEKYMFYHHYHQGSYSYNSENMWFPFPQNRKVYIQGDTTNNKVAAQVYVVGYR